MMHRDQFDTPLGRFAIVVDEQERLCLAGFAERQDSASGSVYTSATDVLDPAGYSTAFRRYFAGDVAALTAINVRIMGTDFQRQVWTALLDIPCGHTCSYLDIAHRIGNPKAVRAVGRANGANPIAIAVPCHRVIGGDGSLTGYGGGIDRKRWLIAHERGGGFADLALWSGK
jgi:methylated-DNA-[protein]-cysteine S-methyltransferase